ncbi:MAG: hypothetical protein IJA72_01435, partial [Clostridia bacterium]|nr:hypothetical protein [Clostridia bacterium]
VDLETRFKELGFPRKPKYKDNKQELITEIEAYKKAGKSFHITRKKLPFFPRLHVYAETLKRQGVELSHEQIMKGLGHKDYSDTYFRCMGIFELEKYRDDKGFVDSYRKNARLKAYIRGLASSLDLPYYLVVTLLGNEQLEKCYIDTEYIQYVKTQLQQHVKEYGSLKGIKTKNRSLYDKVRTLMKYYGDGGEAGLSAEDWLDIFDLGDVENNFRNIAHKEMDVTYIMEELKKEFGNRVITAKDIDSKKYRLIIKKAIQLGIPIKELFRNYSLNYNGISIDRLSSMQVTEIPYLEEMKQVRDMWLQAKGYTKENGYCKEEIFEARVEACQYAYNKFKDKMFNFEVSETISLEEKIDL